MATKHDDLTPAERRYLEHAREAEKLGLSLPDYHRSAGLSVYSLYNVRRQLLRKEVVSSRRAARREPKPVYFLALMTEALIERDIRARMRKLDIKKLPLYPEERPCAAPTTERLFELFADLRRHRLVDESGRVHQRFYDTLSEPQRTVLRLFKLSPQEYLAAAEEPAAR